MAVAKNKVKRVAVETEPAPKPTRKSAELEKHIIFECFHLTL